MKKIALCAVLASCFLSFTPNPGAQAPLLGGQNEAVPKLVINNRILAKVHGKAISVIDVMKQMDLSFYQRFPEYSHSLVARYQFYLANWRYNLDQLIDRELIMADAREIKLPVSKGEVREEMERNFGPHVMVHLAKMNLTFDEAFKMIEDDIRMRRMVYMRVNYKANNEVTPQVIKDSYELYAKGFVNDETWTYQVLSLRGAEQEALAQVANRAQNIMTDGKPTLEELKASLESSGLPESVAVSVSSDFEHGLQDISEDYLTVLANLLPGEISPPQDQLNRRNMQRVYRVFYLKDRVQASPDGFQALARNIETELLQEAMASETNTYIKSLRERYDPNQELASLCPENFQPFVLL